MLRDGPAGEHHIVSRIPVRDRKNVDPVEMLPPPLKSGGSCQEGDCKKETIALLTYMLQHNEHHAQELDQMAENLDKMGLAASAKAIRDAVADFQKSNMRLGLALTLVKEELK